MRRIGIDVGGTNTDAVLLEDGRVIHAVKTPTTEDVTGGISTALDLLGRHPEVARGGIDKVNAILALGEMVPAEEVGELIAFLSSGRARHLSGATIDVNGATYVR